MADRAPVAAVAKIVGAQDRIYLRQRRKEHYLPIWTLDLENDRAAALIKAVYPFLLGKKNQAKMALALFRLRQKSRDNKVILRRVYDDGAIVKGHGVPVLSDSYVRRCDRIYLKMRRRVFTTT